MKTFRRARFTACLPLTAMLLATWGCGPGVITDDGTPQQRLHTVRATITGSLTSAESVRAALAWTVSSPELVACLDAVEVEGVLTFSAETFEQDTQIADALQRCLVFSERATRETASVALGSSAPLTLEIPVLSLPDVELLSGTTNALLGIAHVLVYEDSDGDNTFDETPRGADAFADVVKGTSRAIDVDASTSSFVVFREGALSPIWKLYRALYGCADPQLGFSTVTLARADDGIGMSCLVNDAALSVELREDIASLGCAPLGDSGEPRRADSVDGIPLDASSACEQIDGYYDVYYSQNPESVCPEIHHLTLVGCDTTTEATCAATYYNLLGDEPSWWPCTFNDGTDPVMMLTSTDQVTPSSDVLFTIDFVNGLDRFATDDVEIEIDMPDGSVARSFTTNVIDDDGNSIFNAGDRVVVSETQDLFNDNRMPGHYPVRVLHAGELVETLTFTPPLTPIPVPSIDFEIADATDAISEGSDAIAILTWVGGDDVSFAVGDLRVSGYLGGEWPFAPLVLLFEDDNNDGRFGFGDRLLFREPADAEEWENLTPELLSSFGSLANIEVAVPVGFNQFEWAASIEVTLN